MSSPEWAVDGRKFEVFGQLLEKGSGEPISFGSVKLRIGTESLEQINTDQEGYFSLTTSITNVGNHPIHADFTETEYFLPSQDEGEIDIFPITLDLDVPENATRGLKERFISSIIFLNIR